MRISFWRLIMIALAAIFISGCNGDMPKVDDEVANSSKVKEGFKDAWVKSRPENASDALTGEEHEEGGWIVKDTETGTVQTFPTTPGKPNREQPAAARLPAPPYFEDPDTKKKYADDKQKYEIIGGYHTHPFGKSERINQPSDDDKQYADKVGVPEYVVSEDGVYKYDPSKKDDPETKAKDERVTQVEEKNDTDTRNKAAKEAKKS